MKNSIAIIFIIILGTVLYSLTLRGIPGNPNPLTAKADLQGDFRPMELSPERGRFAHVLSLAEYGTYELPEVLADFTYPDVGIYSNRFYSFFAPGVSYIATPFYIFGKTFDLGQLFAFALVSLISIGAMIFMFKIAREIFDLPIWASIAAPIFFAFGSSAWSYAITLYQHHFTVFFFMAGFYSAWRYGQDAEWSWIWGFIPWISYAAAISVDYPNALFLLPVMIYFFWNAWKIKREGEKLIINFRYSFILVSIGFILITAWQLNLNNTHFGGWFKLAGGIPSYKGQEIVPGAENESVKPNKEKDVVAFFSERRIPFGAYILMVSPERGLIIFWPLAVLAAFGLYEAFKVRRPEVSALIGGVFLNCFLYFSWGDPWGGWAFGPRYLILSISILSLFATYWLAHYKNISHRILGFLLFAYSSAVSVAGALTTNAIPPKVEAVPLGADYTFFRNFNFLLEGRSGSFVFNTYAHTYFSLLTFGIMIYALLILIMYFLIFIIPRKENGA